MPEIIDLIGKRFGRWTVINLNHYQVKTRVRYWNCTCDCGNTGVIAGNNLRHGRSTSCGCGRAKIDGRLGPDGKISGTYHSWNNMIARCSRPSYPDYDEYGGRGIEVCERWLKFSNFFEDMGHRPDGTTLDRKRVNDNYEPDNCRWATNKEQQRNKRNTVMVTYKGERMPLMTAIELTGIPYNLVYVRMKLGWKDENLFIEPTRQQSPLDSNTHA